MNLNLYLKRIGVESAEEPSLEFLARLQKRHMLSVPFEDLDIPHRARIELDPDKLFNKIVVSGRGGFCYELNSMFYNLLTSLGFKADMLSARVYNQKKAELGPEFDHMCLLVHLDEDYLVDVGFGDSYRIPIKMPDGKIQDISGCYKVVKTGQYLFELQKQQDGLELLQYQFSTTPRNINDYKQMCDFQQDSPTSHFRIRNLCTIATETGRITLNEDSLTITEGKKKTKTDFNTVSEFNFFLKKHFNIELQ